MPPATVTIVHPVLGGFAFSTGRGSGELMRPDAGWNEFAERLREAAVDLNAWEPLRDHPLIPSRAVLLTYAVENDDAELVEILLAAGADPAPRMIERALSERVARMLLAAGAPVTPDETGASPLHHARSEAAVRVLLEAGCDPLHADEDGSTPVMRARGSGMNRQAFQLLRNAAAARAAMLPGRGVRFKRSKAPESHVRAFVEARLRAASHLDWGVACIPMPLDVATEALAKALSGKVFGLKTEIARRIERDVSARALVAREGVFVFRPARGAFTIAFLGPDQPRGAGRHAQQEAVCAALSASLGCEITLLQDMIVTVLHGDARERFAFSVEEEAELRGFKSAAAERAREHELTTRFEAFCAERAITFPDMSAEGDGIRMWLSIRGWKEKDVGPVNFIVTVD
jgi:hypothetical protein